MADQKTPTFQGSNWENQNPTYQVNPNVKLPEWVKCKVCGKGPTGYNWLKPVSPDPNCRVLIHLDCIESGLSRKMANMAERGNLPWNG